MAISARERASFRLSVARRETPRALAVVGACFVVVTTANALFGPPMEPALLLLNAAVAALLLTAATLVRVPRMPARAWTWAAALCALAMVSAGQVQVWLDPDGAAFAYVLLIIVAYAPLTLNRGPAAIVAVPMVAGCFVISRPWPAEEATDWMIASLAAVGIGMALLWLRLRSIDEMAELSAQVGAFATRDPLTGALNRHGVEERVPQLVGMAVRQHEPVFAMFLDIVGLKRANDVHGHHFGDQVIIVVADAVRASARSGDLVGRWGGDEFIVLGIGRAQQPDIFVQRVVDHIRHGAVDVHDWPIDVSIGSAVSIADDVDLEELIGRADVDMYARRRTVRGTG